MFYLLFGVVSGGAGVMPSTGVVSRWFDRRRALPFERNVARDGVCQLIILPSVAQQMVRAFGWRLSYSIFGLAILPIPLPIVAVFLERETRKHGSLAGWVLI